jgi:hypothetical protein
MSGPPMDEARRLRLGIIVPDWVIAGRVAKWHEHSGIQGVIWDLSSSHGASMTGSTLNYYGDIHKLGELAAKTDAELQAIRRLGPVGMGLVREVLRLWRDRRAELLAAGAGEAVMDPSRGPEGFFGWHTVRGHAPYYDGAGGVNCWTCGERFTPGPATCAAPSEQDSRPQLPAVEHPDPSPGGTRSRPAASTSRGQIEFPAVPATSLPRPQRKTGSARARHGRGPGPVPRP